MILLQSILEFMHFIIKVLFIFKHLILKNIELHANSVYFIFIVSLLLLVLHYECLDLRILDVKQLFEFFYFTIQDFHLGLVLPPDVLQSTLVENLQF
jgi:hypothetical protein